MNNNSKRIIIDYEIVSETPVFIRERVDDKDIGIARDREMNHMIPGTTIKGFLRWEMNGFLSGAGLENCDTSKRCKDRCPVCNIFGSLRKSGLIRFENAFSQRKDSLRKAGAMIDRSTKRSVLSYETEVSPPGTVYCGRMILENPGEYVLGALLTTIDYVNRSGASLGGGKTKGMGICKFKILRITEFTPKDYFESTPGTAVFNSEEGVFDIINDDITGKFIHAWLGRFKKSSKGDN